MKNNKDIKKEYEKFINDTVMFGILLALSLIAYSTICFIIIDNIETADTCEAKAILDLKDTAAIGTESPKLIYFGGSSVSVGINTTKIGKEFGIRTVNYGIMLPLQLYSVTRLREIVKPGDMIVIALEYDFFSRKRSLAFQSRPVMDNSYYVIKHDKEYFAKLDAFEKINYMTIGLEDLINLALNMVENCDQNKKYVIGKKMGSNGNRIKFIPKDKIILKNVENGIVKLPQNNETFESYETTRTIKELIFWAKQNNIAVIAAYPPLAYKDKFEEERYTSYFKNIEDFYVKNEVETVGHPQDYFYAPEMFVDSIYHLNEVGANIHTDKIIKGLKQDKFRTMIEKLKNNN